MAQLAPRAQMGPTQCGARHCLQGMAGLLPFGELKDGTDFFPSVLFLQLLQVQ